MSLQLKRGPVVDVDVPNQQVRIGLADQNNMPSCWLRVPQRRTKGTQDVDMPVKGEALEVLIDSNGADGVVLGAIFDSTNLPASPSADVRTTVYDDGTTVSYDRSAHKLTINVASGGDVDLTAAGNVVVNGAMISLAGAGGLPVARQGDAVQVNTVTGTGTIIAGSSKVLAGG